jgi:hypothetical protein
LFCCTDSFSQLANTKRNGKILRAIDFIWRPNFQRQFTNILYICTPLIEHFVT